MSKQFNNYQQRGGGGYGGGAPRQPEAPRLSDSELLGEFSINGFFETDGQIKAPLISDTGRGNVRQLADRLAAGKKDAGDAALNPHQLRKFYDAFSLLESVHRMNRSKTAENEAKVQLLMLKANAHYAGQRLKTRLFNLFIEERISLVLNANGDQFNESMKVFKLHFGALVAYFPKN
jgi:CRISPR type III-A-associated protein Csm2